MKKPAKDIFIIVLDYLHFRSIQYTFVQNKN